MKNTNTYAIINTIVFICLVLLPFTLWGNRFIVGGDDTKLFYIFPEYFLRNYTFNIISDNTLAGATTGYAPVSYFAPLFMFIYILKSLSPVNVQMLMFGLNMALGYLFFYHFVGLWIKDKDPKILLLRILSSFIYVFSVYLLNTLYSHQLISMYLISIIPAVLYFFNLALERNKMVFTLVSLLIFSIFSTTLNTYPWWSAFAITSIPLIVYWLLLYKLVFIKQALIFLLISFLVNIHWIFHLLYARIGDFESGSTLSSYSSQNFINDNLRVVSGVSRLFSPLNVVFGRMNSQFGTGFQWFWVFGIFSLCVIVICGAFISINKSKSNIQYYIPLLSFLISWFLFSPNLGQWGPRLFLELSTEIPFFTAYRNMFDKFSLSLSFYLALVLFIGLAILIKNKGKLKLANSLLAVVFLITILNILSFYMILSHKEVKYFSGEFTSEFTEIVNYFKNENDRSKILWLPLNFPTYLILEDSNRSGDYYAGLSPMRVLADRSDITGKFSFLTHDNLFLGDVVLNLIENGEYSEVSKIFSNLGVGFVVVDHQSYPSEVKPFLFGGEEFPLLSMQNDEFYNEILGEKIKEISERYSIYLINDKYRKGRIFTQDEDGRYHSNSLDYKKISSSLYKLKIDDTTQSRLVFLDPYTPNWILRSSDGEIIQSKKYEDYGNVFNVDFGPKEYTLEFEPSKFDKYLWFIAIGTVIMVSVYLMIVIYNNEIKENLR